MKLLKTQSAYLAGFLDGDGSIYVRLKPDRQRRYGFQIYMNVVFYQSAEKGSDFLKELKELIGEGYIRFRNDGIAEYIIGDESSIKSLLEAVLPYLKYKREQAKITLKIINRKISGIESAKKFLAIARLIDEISSLNYSKKRTQNSEKVEQVLTEQGLLTP